MKKVKIIKKDIEEQSYVCGNRHMRCKKETYLVASSNYVRYCIYKYLEKEYLSCVNMSGENLGEILVSKKVSYELFQEHIFYSPRKILSCNSPVPIFKWLRDILGVKRINVFIKRYRY